MASRAPVQTRRGATPARGEGTTWPKARRARPVFYFLDVDRHDDLFIEVAWALLGRKPTRAEKPGVLRRLQEMGVFLIDTRLDPDDGSSLAPHVAGLIGRCRRLRPEHVVLIATSVYDAAYARLEAAGIPVVDKRIAFPSTGRQGNFRRQFSEALEMTGESVQSQPWRRPKRHEA